jgi:hypothetical protein
MLGHEAVVRSGRRGRGPDQPARRDDAQHGRPGDRDRHDEQGSETGLEQVERQHGGQGQDQASDDQQAQAELPREPARRAPAGEQAQARRAGLAEPRARRRLRTAAYEDAHEPPSTPGAAPNVACPAERLYPAERRS